MEGILVITALRCKLTRDTEAFGKMDPYCLFQVQDQKAMTKVIIDAGKECEWNETFTFHIKDGDKLKYQVWDEDPGTDDLVGEGFLTIGQYYVEKQSFWLALTYGDKTAGELAIEIQLCALEKDKIEKTKNLQNLIKEKTSQLEQFVQNKQPDVEIINSNNDQDDERKKQILKAIEIDKIKIFELESNLKEAKTKIENQLDDENYVLAQQKKKIDCLKEENENLSKILDNFKKKILNGYISINCEKANIVRDTETIGKMDPFVVFSIGDREVKSEIAKDAGKYPVWNQQLKLDRNDEEILNYTLYDYNDILESQLIGYGGINLFNIIHRPSEQCNKEFPIIYSGKKIGFLDLGLKYNCT